MMGVAIMISLPPIKVVGRVIAEIAPPGTKRTYMPADREERPP